MDMEMVAEINRERAVRGIGALTVDERLAAAAQRHAEDMAWRGVRGHVGSDTSTMLLRMVAAGFWPARYAEVVGWEYDAAEMVAWWLGSDSHRRWVLWEEVDRVGVGFAWGNDGAGFWCVDFAREREAKRHEGGGG